MQKMFPANNLIQNKSLALLLIVSLLAGLFYPFLSEGTQGRAAEETLVEEFAGGKYENCTASLLLASEGNIITSNAADMRIGVNKLNQWAFVYYVLTMLGSPRPSATPTPTPSPTPTPEPEEGEEEATEPVVPEATLIPEISVTPEPTEEPSPTPVPVTITLKNTVTVHQQALDAANKLNYHENIGLVDGDRITLETLLKMFILTQADDVREAIIAYVARTEANAVNGMNGAARSLGLTNTNYATTTNLYNSRQYTTVRDFYILYTELMKQPLFAECIRADEMKLSYMRSGKQLSVLCKNDMYGGVLLYGEAELPENWTMLCRMSGACESGGGAQLVAAIGPDGNEYVAVIGNIPFEKDVAIEMKRFLELKKGYSDAKQELPLGDDTVRYKYLLNSAVEYYTMDNRAPEYLTQAMTDRYMMNITVKVWKMNEATGERYTSTMTVPIHRKLYQSLKEIMEEVYELPIQFPMKMFAGYGYRKSGGVGLTGCTLMSVHSYGAAVDINNGDFDNDYYLGKGNDLRDKTNPYCIPDEVIAIFEAHGWNWGGNFEIASDTMHFQYLGLDYLSYQDRDPFVKLSTSGTMDVGKVVANLQDRLAELGYNVNRNGIYNNTTRTALMKFQARNGLPVTGEVDYKTWETIINLTHYMKFVF